MKAEPLWDESGFMWEDKPWKGKELAERLMTQAWVTFYGCYIIKIDWFGLQVLSTLFHYACGWAGLNIASSGWQLICPFLRDVLLPDRLTPNQFKSYTMILVLFKPVLVTTSSLPPIDVQIANEDGGMSTAQKPHAHIYPATRTGSTYRRKQPTRQYNTCSLKTVSENQEVVQKLIFH